MNVPSSKNNFRIVVSSVIITIIICLFIYLFVLHGFHQKHSESISKEDKEIIINLCNSSFKLARENPKAALDNGRLALNMSIQKNWVEGQASAHNSIAACFFGQQKYDSSAFHFYSSLSLDHSAGIMRQAAANLHNLGVIYNFIGDYKNSLHHLDSAENKYKELGDTFPYQKANIYLAKESNYFYLAMYDSATAYNEKSTRIFESLGMKDSIGELINNTADLQGATGDYFHAIMNYKKSEELFRANGDSISMATLYANEALSFINCSDSVLQALGIRNATRIDLVTSLLNMAQNICNSQNEGVKLYLASAEIHKARSDLNEKLNNFRQALTEYKLYHSLRDSITNVTIQNKIAFQAGEAAYKVHEINEKLIAEEIESSHDDKYKAAISAFALISAFVLLILIAPYKSPLNEFISKTLRFLFIVAFLECVTFTIHFFLHKEIAESPSWILFILIILAIVTSWLHHQIGEAIGWAENAMQSFRRNRHK